MMRFFDWCTLGIHATMALAWFVQWRINRRLLATNAYQALMLQAMSGAWAHENVKRYFSQFESVKSVDPRSIPNKES